MVESGARTQIHAGPINSIMGTLQICSRDCIVGGEFGNNGHGPAKLQYQLMIFVVDTSRLENETMNLELQAVSEDGMI